MKGAFPVDIVIKYKHASFRGLARGYAKNRWISAFRTANAKSIAFEEPLYGAHYPLVLFKTWVLHTLEVSKVVLNGESDGGVQPI